MRSMPVALLLFCLWANPARGDTMCPTGDNMPPIPDTGDWMIVQKSRIEIRISSGRVAYLGSDTEQTRSHKDGLSNEFMRVIRRHAPAIFVRSQLGGNRSFLKETTTRYSQKEEADQLAELDKKAEPFLYLYWRSIENPITKRSGLEGDVNIWMLKPGGECLFVQNEKVGVEILSENIGDGKPRNILNGIKYQIGDIYHILKIDRGDLIAALGETASIEAEAAGDR